MKHKILSADFHRNGVGGAGFYVALIETDEGDGPQRYLTIDFTGDPEDADYDPGRFAVLRVDQVAQGNIGMYPIFDPDSGEKIPGTGGAAYRGADRWGVDLRHPIRDWVRASSAALRSRS